MKISYKWLGDFVELKDYTIKEIAERLTLIGLEVEAIENYESIQGGLRGVVVGYVQTVEQHPGADRLRVCKVDVGKENLLQIVCGAPNVAEGQKVPVALIGTTLYPTSGEPILLKASKIRNIASEGMICAEDELGLGNSHEGILVLNTDVPPGTACADILPGIYTDTIFHIGLTPNRTDAISHYGVARDLAAALKRNLKPYTPTLPIGQFDCPINIEIQDTEKCPRYTGMSISNITMQAAPLWMQNRLKAVGQRSINAIVDITNYVMLEMGQPLHAFDPNTIAQNKIIVRPAFKDEKFITLDEKELKLNDSDLVIADAEKASVLAGVKGGLNSGVTDNTTHIFLESAYFKPQAIRKTARAYGIHTDTAYRFERGTNPDATTVALARAAELILQVCGGSVSKVADVYPNPISPITLEFNPQAATRIWGCDIPMQEIKEILSALDYKIVDSLEEESGVVLKLEVPLYRVDVKRQRDVEEDIIRIFGLNNVPIAHKINATLDFTQSALARTISRKLAATLCANGLHEIKTNSLVPEKWTNDQVVRLVNPLSEEHCVMRSSLIPSALEVVAHNFNRQMNDVQIFEFGKIYNSIKGTINEIEQLLVVLTGDENPLNWRNKSQSVDLFSIKKIGEQVFRWLNLPKLALQELSDDEFTAFGYALLHKKERIAQYGMISPKWCKQFDLRQAPVYFLLDFSRAVELLQPQPAFAELARFPMVRRDLSMLVDNVPFSLIQQTIIDTNPKLIKEVQLFDVFQPKESTQRSYALAIWLQSETKTLADVDIDKTMSRVQAALEKLNGITLRV